MHPLPDEEPNPGATPTGMADSPFEGNFGAWNAWNRGANKSKNGASAICGVTLPAPDGAGDCPEP